MDDLRRFVAGVDSSTGKLFFLRLFEGLLFCLTCVSLLLVGLDGIGIIANSVSLASVKVVCELNKTEIPQYVELMDKDNILAAFLKTSTVNPDRIDEFCIDMNNIRSNLSKFWYANFFAIVAQVILTISAYQNYVITAAVWQSSLYGNEVDEEVEKKREERERAKELKKKQKDERKASRKNLETELTLKNEKSKSRNSTNLSDANTSSAYGNNSASDNSAYGMPPSGYDKDGFTSKPDNGYDKADTSDEEVGYKESEKGDGAYGGEWWKESDC